MVETGVNSFTSPGDVGPLYPFVDATLILVIIGILLWIGWHVWHLLAENKEFDDAARLYREVGLERAMHHGGTGHIASEEEMKITEVYKAMHEEYRNNNAHTSEESPEEASQKRQEDEGDS